MSVALLAVVVAAAPCPPLEDEPSIHARCRLEALPASRPVPVEGLAAVFQRPGFEEARARPDTRLQLWLEQLKEWFFTLFESSGAQSYSSTTRVVVLGLAAAVVAWALVSRRGRRALQALPSGPVADPAAHGRSAAEHLELARRLCTTAPRDALREAWVSVLVHVEAERLLRQPHTRTNRELVAGLGERGLPAERVASIRALADTYDEAFYSLAPVSQAQASEFIDRVAPVVGGAP